MRTALDLPDKKLDEHERNFVSKIREHGWFNTRILAEAEDPGFSFTTGFWVNTSQPELIIFSLRDGLAHDVLWDLFREAKAGVALAVGKRTDQVFANLPAYVFPMAKRHYREHLGWSRWFYGGDKFPCLQIVWPDREGLFPWEPGFDPAFANDQPDLTEKGWQAARLD